MFIDAAQFNFLRELESRWTEIRDEYLLLPSSCFDPWVQRQMHGEGWSVYGLYALGQSVSEAARLCPNTLNIIDKIPGVSLAGYSRLAPKTHIQPHVGWAKSVYRLHLGLVVPPACGLRVEHEERCWQEGKCLIFDDTLEHEAWNNSEAVRATLMIDFLRPGIKDFSDDNIPEGVREYAQQLLNLN